MLIICLVVLYLLGSLPALKWMNGHWFRFPSRRKRLVRISAILLCGFYSVGALLLSFVCPEDDLM